MRYVFTARLVHGEFVSFSDMAPSDICKNPDCKIQEEKYSLMEELGFEQIPDNVDTEAMNDILSLDDVEDIFKEEEGREPFYEQRKTINLQAELEKRKDIGPGIPQLKMYCEQTIEEE